MKRGLVGAGLFTLGATIAYRRVVRPWHERWGATEEEQKAALPGDDLIAEPAAQITRGITIEVPPEDVWPWVIQIGADRGGFYSYDGLENALGLDIHSADEIEPRWQERAVGDLMHADAKGTAGWYVMDVRPNHALVVKMADVKNGRPFEREDGALMEFTWAFVLRARADGATHLLVRERAAFRNKLAQFLISPVGFISFVMTQKMMRGIKERAEKQDAGTNPPIALAEAR